jgi:hypothetical protein
MTSGRPLTEREQIHILRWANRKSWGQIADELMDMTPDKSRKNPKALSKWYNQYTRSSKKKTIVIPDYLYNEIEMANLDDVALSFIVSTAIRSYFLTQLLKA